MTEKLATSDCVSWRPGEIVSTYEHCAGEIRFNNGVLEQLWILHRIGMTGAIEQSDHEWRPVPTVNDDNGELSTKAEEG